ncbi:hypothetical protein GCM10009817_40450 [Terrabacter lapilli]|uniref:Uncharacterized protein n=1 Tax=Terrabacter lapilli TaxID=436231 RepID=A0ABP5EBE4_9MICO
MNDPLGLLPLAPSARHLPAQLLWVTAPTRGAHLWHTASEQVARGTTTTGDHVRHNPPENPENRAYSVLKRVLQLRILPGPYMFVLYAFGSWLTFGLRLMPDGVSGDG